MATSTDHQRAQQIVFTYDMARRLGFSPSGAYQLVSAQPVAALADRRRLALVLGAVAAAEKTGAPARLTRNLERGLYQVIARLQELGLSAAGAEQVMREVVVMSHQDRVRIPAIIGAFVHSTGGRVFDVYDYPGAYAQRFDGIDK